MSGDTARVLDALRSIRKRAGHTRNRILRQAKGKAASQHEPSRAEAPELLLRAQAWQEAIDCITVVIQSIDPNAK